MASSPFGQQLFVLALNGLQQGFGILCKLLAKFFAQVIHNAGDVIIQTAFADQAGFLPFWGDAHQSAAAVIGIGLALGQAILLQCAQSAGNRRQRLLENLRQVRNIHGTILAAHLNGVVQPFQNAKMQLGGVGKA